MISLRLSEQSEKLRKDFELWLKSNPPPIITGRVELDDYVNVSREWQSKLASERWIAVHWPERFGGRGLTLVDEAIIQEKLAEASAPQLVNIFGLTMVGPVLIKHGTEEQQKRFLPKILTAEEIWCQGFSETEAGSDLASLRTTGVIDPEDNAQWRITGQKTWTSFAQYAAWCFVLVRTNPELPRHKGLSYFLVPMNSKGIDVRPLQQISGDREFNEIFFDNVSISNSNIVGGIGEGWKIAISTLMYERAILTFARHLQSEEVLNELSDFMSNGKAEKATIVRYGQLVAKSMAVRALAFSHLINYDENNTPGPEGSMDKLFWSETFQEICKFAGEVIGPSFLLSEGDDVIGSGVHQHRYLYSRGRTIAAGTSEIQRNIIAERVLGLPR
jgi:alkylation response protein AidB-like acyl-CoA dehydrogenase